MDFRSLMPFSGGRAAAVPDNGNADPFTALHREMDQSGPPDGDAPRRRQSRPRRGRPEGPGARPARHCPMAMLPPGGRSMLPSSEPVRRPR